MYHEQIQIACIKRMPLLPILQKYYTHLLISTIRKIKIKIKSLGVFWVFFIINLSMFTKCYMIRSDLKTKHDIYVPLLLTSEQTKEYRFIKPNKFNCEI